MIFEEFQNSKHLQIIKDICSDENYFRNYLSVMDKETFIFLYESIMHTYKSSEMYLNIILKMKKLINGVSDMHASLLIQDAFKKIIEQTCRILNCDRASVFVVDIKKNELWTKVAKGISMIRIPIGQGLVGYVASKGETLNILDECYRFVK